MIKEFKHWWKAFLKANLSYNESKMVGYKVSTRKEMISQKLST
jgi:hypothetical protein